MPHVDVCEKKDSYVLEMELPGYTENDVELDLKDRVLTIASKMKDAKKAEKEEKKEAAETVYLVKERRNTTFTRSFTMPEDIDQEKVTAEFKNGLLTVVIPRKAETQTYIVGPILLYTFASWACTTILDGKGKLKEIFLMTCYSLFPLAWCSGIALALSNVLTGTELAIYRLIYALGYVLMGYMIFTGMITIHEFGLGKTLFSLILTLVAAIVIVFVILLMYELFQKMFGFLYTLYTEITQRDLLRFRK